MMKVTFILTCVLLSVFTSAQQVHFDYSPSASYNTRSGSVVASNDNSIFLITSEADGKCVLRKGGLQAAPGKSVELTLSPKPDFNRDPHLWVAVDDGLILLYNVTTTIKKNAFSVDPIPYLQVHAAKFSLEGKLIKNEAIITEQASENDVKFRDLEIRFAKSADKTNIAVMAISAISDAPRMEVVVLDKNLGAIWNRANNIKQVIANSKDAEAKFNQTENMLVGNNGVVYISSLLKSSREGKKAELGPTHALLLSITKTQTICKTIAPKLESMLNCDMMLRNNTLYVVNLYGEPQSLEYQNTYPSIILGAFVVQYNPNNLQENNSFDQLFKEKGFHRLMGQKIYDMDLLQDGSIFIGLATSKTGYGSAFMLKLNADVSKNYRYNGYLFQYYEKGDDLGTASYQFQVIGNEVIIFCNQTPEYVSCMEGPDRSRRMRGTATTWRMGSCISWQTTLDEFGKIKSEGRLVKAENNFRIFTSTAYKENNTLYFTGESGDGSIVARSIVK